LKSGVGLLWVFSMETTVAVKNRQAVKPITIPMIANRLAGIFMV